MAFINNNRDCFLGFWCVLYVYCDQKSCLKLPWFMVEWLSWQPQQFLWWNDDSREACWIRYPVPPVKRRWGDCETEFEKPCEKSWKGSHGHTIVIRQFHVLGEMVYKSYRCLYKWMLNGLFFHWISWKFWWFSDDQPVVWSQGDFSHSLRSGFGTRDLQCRQVRSGSLKLPLLSFPSLGTGDGHLPNR